MNSGTISLVKNLALGIVSTSAIMLVLEGSVRWLGAAPALMDLSPDRVDEYIRSDNPQLGYVMKPNSTQLHTNADGYRGVRLRPQRHENTNRMVVLGDSVTYGSSIQEDANTIPAKLAAYLPDVEVANFGVNGYCTRGEVAFLEAKGLVLNPDVVLVVFVENDYDDLNSEVKTIESRSANRALSMLWRSSHLARWVGWRLRLFDLPEQEAELLQRSHMDAVGSDNVRHGLTVLRDLSRQYGFTPVIAVWPSFGVRGVLHREQGVVRDFATKLRVESLAQSLGIAVIRMSEYFIQDVKKRGPYAQSLYSRDGMHPTPHAADIAARGLASDLSRLMDQTVSPP